MARAAKPCGTPGCPEVVSEGSRCPAHVIKRPHTWDWAQKAPKPKHWNKISGRIRRRDKHRCVICGHRGVTVDHLLPRAWGGTEKHSNLRVLCNRHAADKLSDESRLGKVFARDPSQKAVLLPGFLEAWG